MTSPDPFDEILARTLDDHRLSRSERSAIKAVLEEERPDGRRLAELRSRAFDAARRELSDNRDSDILEWLEGLVKILQSKEVRRGGARLVEAIFSPGDACVHRIAGLIEAAQRSLDICVYTITDDRIANPVVAAHGRGVAIRIITDDEKADDLGSDIDRFKGAGIRLATDHSRFQMHHKFAVFDGSTVVTGSYNWTRAAAEQNQENIVISDDPRLVEPYEREFERLWKQFAPRMG